MTEKIKHFSCIQISNHSSETVYSEYFCRKKTAAGVRPRRILIGYLVNQNASQQHERVTKGL